MSLRIEIEALIKEYHETAKNLYIDAYNNQGNPICNETMATSRAFEFVANELMILLRKTEINWCKCPETYQVCNCINAKKY